jgi:glucose/mannose transport system permease protein
MPESAGNIFSPPSDHLPAWIKAWAEACTASTATASAGFWNSVILGPSVSPSRRRRHGYRARHWRFKGSEAFFTILLLGAFIPYQVMLYPIVILLREMGLYGSLWGLVLVHTVFGMPINTLLFRNYFAGVPEELFKAARVDGAGFWGIFFRIMLPMSLPIFVVSAIIQVTGSGTTSCSAWSTRPPSSTR